MLIFNIQAVLKARQIERPFSFLVKSGFSRHAAHNILNNQTRSLRLDTIEKLCEILHCQPNDLLVFKPNPNQNLPESHPLNNLLYKEEEHNWQQTLKTLPLNKLKEISKIINQTTEEQK